MVNKKISILGSTGSIGMQTLEAARNLPNITITALCAHSNIDLLEKQIFEFKPEIAAVMDEEAGEKLKNRIKSKTEILTGLSGVMSTVLEIQADMIVNAIVGSAGLMPTIAAISAKRDVALANKESLVAGGELAIFRESKENGVNIIPVDSEHSAIFQCLYGNNKNKISKIYLTASGGPFRGMKKEQLSKVTVDDALKHPNWKMGPKITIDSATMMNKGLEVIEAKWLFDIPLEKIEVLVHPQSIIHSMVEFEDGSVMAQLGMPDMRIPIQYALTFPERKSNNFAKINFLKNNNLTFEPPDTDVFECLEIAITAAKIGGTMPAVMNMANECAVSLFLNRMINFTDIPVIIRKAMDAYNVKYNFSLDDVMEAEDWTRAYIGNKFLRS